MEPLSLQALTLKLLVVEAVLKTVIANNPRAQQAVAQLAQTAQGYLLASELTEDQIQQIHQQIAHLSGLPAA